MPHFVKQSTCVLLIQDSARALTDVSQRQQTLTAFMRPVDPGSESSTRTETKHFQKPILLCYEQMHIWYLECVVIGAGSAQAGMQQAAAVPKHHTTSSRPTTAREAAMDLIDLANMKVFGNRHFRPKQREIIKAALQVAFALPAPHMSIVHVLGCLFR